MSVVRAIVSICHLVFCCPVPFVTGSAGVAERLCAALGPANLKAAENAVLESLRSEKITGGKLAHRRIRVKASRDSFEQLEWMPHAMRKAGISPEHARDFGAPWFMVQEGGVPRSGHGVVPLTGVGQFLYCYRGAFTIIAWPSDALLKQNVAVVHQVTVLSAYSGPKMAEFMAANGYHMYLDEQEAAWIPNGWQWMSIAEATNEWNSLVTVPIVSMRLNSAMPSSAAASHMDAASTFVNAWKRDGIAPWNTVSDSYLEWWRTVIAACRDVEVAARSAPAVPPPQLSLAANAFQEEAGAKNSASSGSASDPKNEFNLEEDLGRMLDKNTAADLGEGEGGTAASSGAAPVPSEPPSSERAEDKKEDGENGENLD